MHPDVQDTIELPAPDDSGMQVFPAAISRTQVIEALAAHGCP
ncbi:hypothetical protein AB0G85_29885 [Streptomyces sioyaensis]